jgi:hypothetical protein
MKAYDIELKRHDIFCLYSLDGIVTLITDEENPYPCSKSIWDKTTNTFSPSYTVTQHTYNGVVANLRTHNPDKVIFPTYAVPKEDFNEFLSVHIPPTLELSLKWECDKNLYILHKEWSDIIEVGFGCYKDNGTKIHEVAQSILDRYLRLKAFW